MRYVRIAKRDGLQTLDLHRDAMLAAGVVSEQLYADLTSGRKDDWSGLASCLKGRQQGNV